MPKKYDKKTLDMAYDLIINKGYSANKASKELGIDNGTMRKRLKENYDIEFLADGKKKVNSHYFDNIDTAEKAYWLGFLTADGYVGNRNEIELCLAEIDKEHLEKFKKALDASHAITEKRAVLNDKTFKSYRISFKDKHMNQVLKSYGLTNNKSYNAYIPDFIRDSVFCKDYMRGLLDGDGSYINSNNKEDQFAVSICSGSERMINDYIDVVYSNLKLLSTKRKTRNIYEVRIFAQDDVTKFINWIYDQSTVYLNRKYNKISAVLE